MGKDIHVASMDGEAIAVIKKNSKTGNGRLRDRCRHIAAPDHARFSCIHGSAVLCSTLIAWVLMGVFLLPEYHICKV